MNADSSLRPAPPRLTLEEIVDGAAELVAADGLEALSMRKLAKRLDVGVMTVYGYVRTKEELLAALAERLLSTVDWPSDAAGSWQDQIAELFRAVRQVFLQYPQLAPIVVHQRLWGVGLYRGAESALTALRRAGLDDRQTVDAFGALTAFTMGCVQREIGVRSAGADFPGLGELPAGEFDNVIDLAGLLATRNAERDFESGLDLLLRGIASWSQT